MKIQIGRDTALKILSVIVAFLLWSYVITEQNPIVNKDFKIAVDITNMDMLAESGLTILEDTTNFSINLKLKGRRDIIDKLDATKISATADLRGYNEEGDTIIPVEISGVPKETEVISRLNEIIKVKIEPLVTVKMPVNVEITGSTTEGKAAMSAITNPRSISVSGAKSVVDSVKSVSVAMDIDSQNKGVSKEIQAVAYDGNGRAVSNVKMDPANVKVTIPIENTKAIPVEVDYGGVLEDGYVIERITMTPSEVYVTGKKQILDALVSIKTEKINMDYANLSFSKEVKLIVPEGTELTDKEQQIMVNVEIAKEVEQQVTVSELVFNNVPTGFEVVPIEQNFTVRIKGTEKFLGEMEPVELYMDLTGLAEGDSVIAVKAAEQNNVKILSISPSILNVTLRKIE